MIIHVCHCRIRSKIGLVKRVEFPYSAAPKGEIIVIFKICVMEDQYGKDGKNTENREGRGQEKFTQYMPVLDIKIYGEKAKRKDATIHQPIGGWATQT